jgi:hypothetical protein
MLEAEALGVLEGSVRSHILSLDRPPGERRGRRIKAEGKLM